MSDPKEMDRLKREMDGAPITSRPPTMAFRDGWERTFGPKLRCRVCGRKEGDAAMVEAANGDVTCAPCYAAEFGSLRSVGK